jgi:hypothetical protein
MARIGEGQGLHGLFYADCGLKWQGQGCRVPKFFHQEVSPDCMVKLTAKRSNGWLNSGNAISS